jgi:hypothetical protein
MHAQTVYQEFGQIVVHQKASNFFDKFPIETATIGQTERRHLTYPDVANLPRQMPIFVDTFD